MGVLKVQQMVHQTDPSWVVGLGQERVPNLALRMVEQRGEMKVEVPLVGQGKN